MRRPSVLGIVLCAAALLLAGSIAARAETLEWRSGTITLSDGTSLHGEIAFSQNHLYLNVNGAKRRLTVRIGDLSRVETMIESASMEKKWLFKEEGRDEKVYTGEEFPVKEFGTKITFGDGGTAEGHVISQTVFLRREGEMTRYTLSRKQEGRTDQQLSELMYVQIIAFDEPGAGALGAIRLVVKLPQGEKPLRALAINVDSAVGVEGAQTDGATFTFSQCTAGQYGLALISDRTVYVHFPASKQSAGLGEAELREIAEWTGSQRDFFQEQTPLYGAGGPDGAWVLVRMERHGEMSLKEAALVRRYEVWLMHKPGEEWQIIKRFPFHRQMSKEANVPRERLVADAGLACEIGPGRQDVEILFTPGTGEQIHE